MEYLLLSSHDDGRSQEAGTERVGMERDKEVLEKAMNTEEILAMDTLLSKQLVDGVISLLAEVPLL